MNMLTDVLQAQITRLARRMDALPELREGTVASVSPVQVLFPLDSVPTPVRWSIGGLSVGDVVQTITVNRRVAVIGRAGGVRPVTARVGTWNLYYAGAPDHPWSGRRGLLASTVITAGLSALAFQESDFINQVTEQGLQLQESLNAASGSSGRWRAVTMGSRNGVAFDEAVWTWTGVGGCEPSLWAERHLVWLLLRHTTGVMMVMASDHWHPDSGSIRVAQARATRARLGEIVAEYGCTTILGVDMNDWQEGWYGQPPAIMTEDGAFSRLKTLPGATGTTMPTWHDWKSSPPWSEAGQSLGEWLDEIFVTRGTVRSGGIWDTTIPLTSALASDHHLLTATVELHSMAPTVDGSDTGWQPHGGQMASGFVEGWYDPLRWRIRDGVVHWRGRVDPTGSGVVSGNIVTNLPPEVIPPRGLALPCSYPNPESGTATIWAGPDSGGSLWVWATTWSSHGIPRLWVGGSYPQH